MIRDKVSTSFTQPCTGNRFHRGGVMNTSFTMTNHPVSARFMLLAILLPAVACSESGIVRDPGTGGSGAGNGGNGGGSGSGAGGGGAAGTGGSGLTGGSLWPDSGTSTGGTGGSYDARICGHDTHKLERLPAELYVVLDRSESMNRPPVEGGTTTLWAETTSAIDAVVKATDTVVSWGLKVFPPSGGCVVGSGPSVPIALANYTKISEFMKNTLPNDVSPRSTPTGNAMRRAVDYLKTIKTPNPKYILLATDGRPTCNGDIVNGGGDESLADTLTAINGAVTAGYPTFVIGILADAPSAGPLDKMAEAGGRPRDGTPKYYAVALKQELVDALRLITGKVASCTFTLTKTPPDPEQVAVNIDGKRVTRDLTHANGWDYGTGMQSIILYGPPCDQLKTATTATNVDIVFGCKENPIP